MEMASAYVKQQAVITEFLPSSVTLNATVPSYAEGL